MALLGVPTTRKLAKDEEKEVISPTFHMLISARVAMGRTIGPSAATVAPDVVVGLPAVVTRLTGAWNRVESPDVLAGVGVVGFDSTAGRELGARKARDDQAVVVERCARNRIPVLPALGLSRPDDRAARLIEREQLAIELAHKHLAVAEADSCRSARPRR